MLQQRSHPSLAFSPGKRHFRNGSIVPIPNALRIIDRGFTIEFSRVDFHRSFTDRATPSRVSRISLPRDNRFRRSTSASIAWTRLNYYREVHWRRAFAHFGKYSDGRSVLFAKLKLFADEIERSVLDSLISRYCEFLFRTSRLCFSISCLWKGRSKDFFLVFFFFFLSGETTI